MYILIMAIIFFACFDLQSSNNNFNRNQSIIVRCITKKYDPISNKFVYKCLSLKNLEQYFIVDKAGKEDAEGYQIINRSNSIMLSMEPIEDENTKECEKNQK